MSNVAGKSKLPNSQIEILLATLQARFEKNMRRHENLKWAGVKAKLDENPGKMASLHAMERTGGEPDVVEYDEDTNEYLFYDCAAESPKDRRSLCYDNEALESRKKDKPKHSAVGMAAELGIELLTEAQYRYLQELGNFDLKTSSWLATPESIRGLGGAIFGDRRFGRVFVYHNGAESYYAARGFRGALKL
jgi:hypothetical protein